MKRATNIWPMLCMIMFMYSCKETAGPAAYLHAITTTKGLNKKITIHDIDYTFSLIPTEVMALKYTADGNGGNDISKFNKRMQDLKGFVFINIKMQVHDESGSILKHRLKDRSEYEERVMYYEFYAKNDIKLVYNENEVVPQSYQYENHMDLMPYNTMVLAFPLKDKEDFQIVFNDRAFNNLFLKANFKQADIDGLPHLILN